MGPALRECREERSRGSLESRGLLVGSAKEVQPNPCLCRVLHWTQPTHFQRIRTGELWVIACTENWVSCLPVCLDVRMCSLQHKNIL